MLGIFFVAAYYGLAHGFQAGVRRMDDNINYFQYQNITRAFNMSKPPWVYAHNFEEKDKETTLGQKLLELKTTCIYFKTESMNQTNVNFMKHRKKDKDEEMEVTRLLGTFFSTPGIGNKSEPINRDTPNAVTVTGISGGAPSYTFKLLFSDDKHCHILRPFSRDQFGSTPLVAKEGQQVADVPGLSYYQHGAPYRSTPGLCIVLLSDDKARNGGLTKWCKHMYDSACGKEPKFTVVFNQTCPRIPNALGC